MTAAKSRTSVLLVVSLLLNALVLLGSGFFVYRKGGVPYLRGKYYEVVHRQRPDQGEYTVWEWAGYQRDAELHAMAPVEPGDVVFLGDSHAGGAPWSEIFGTARVRNRGINGDVTGGVLRRLDEVTAGRPAAVFMFIGSNDVDAGLGGVTVEAALENVGRILDAIRERSPQTAVYVLSAPPKSGRSTLNATESPLAHRLNAGFAELAPAHGATYLDVTTLLSEPDGSLKVAYTADGSHLNAEGYRRVLEVVRPYVERHLGTGA